MRTIILSAGHGGSDPGAVGNGLRESDLNLSITLACRDYLNKFYTGHRLVLPRDRDVYVSLPARRDLTVREKADLYVSMHNNAFNITSARGFETFTNSGELYGATLAYQKILHNTVYSYLESFGVPNRGMKRFDHWVTRSMPCPTVLMEYLFVTSPADAALMKRPGFLQNLGALTGEGIAKALSLPKKTIVPTPTPQPTPAVPEVIRPILVQIEGRQTSHEAWLLKGDDVGTFGRLHPILTELGYKVEGKDDILSISKR